jgi:CheY-like chemotaxis protein
MLDIVLPDIDGWRVLSRLKNDVSTRHIPVAVMSTEEARTRAFQMGAVDFACKPLHTGEDLVQFVERLKSFIERPARRLLLVQSAVGDAPDPLSRMKIEGVQTASAPDCASALRLLHDDLFDCIVVDPDHAGLEALAKCVEARNDPRPISVVVRRSNGMDDRTRTALHRLENLSAVRIASTADALVDQTAMLLHVPIDQIPAEHRTRLQSMHQSDEILQGKRVLIVDDDIRNIFALSSILEWHDMAIFSAETGRDAIDILRTNPEMDVVLMDIMMPEMDGYQTIAAIRQIPQFKSLPIIAVTAKAMKGDREKCIEAGAWDYLSKPVDPQQLLSVLRAWMQR